MTEKLLAEISLLKRKLEKAERERDEFRQSSMAMWRELYCEFCCNYDKNGGCQAEYEVLKDIGIDCIQFERRID